jgi:NAD+ synthetase
MWDGQYPREPVQEAAKAGARLLVVINASPYDAGKPARRIQRIRELHRSTGLPLIYVNNVGIGDNPKNILVFDGRSMAFDKAGHMVACAPALKEDLLVFDLNEDLLGASMEPPTEEYDQEVYDTLVFALRSYARTTGFSRALVGMSGGVDSALCAAIAADALGPRNVLGVSLPSRYNAADGQADALAVCRNLGIESAVMPIEELCGHTAAAYGKWQEIKRDVSLQNIQARLRGLLLMAISNEQDRLLIATGNKTEIGQGYCTLYGDTAGAMLLIGDLNKMQVYSLAGYVNRRAGRDIIPESVLQRVPSAELAPGQVDPFDYPVAAPLVDDIIALRDPVAIIQRYRSKSLGERYPADLYERYDERQFRALLEHSWRLYVWSAFKRAQSGPVVVVSSRAVGFDLRESIVNKWDGGVQT